MLYNKYIFCLITQTALYYTHYLAPIFFLLNIYSEDFFMLVHLEMSHSF